MKILAPGATWLPCLRRYVLFLAGGNLLWEALHMPLYTLWNEGTLKQIALYGLHCVGGDLLIGSATLLLALIIFATSDWPSKNYMRITIVTILMGILYTFWSEWYNVKIATRWAYADAMPVIPIVEIGVSPLAQWLVIPLVGFWWAKR